MTSCTKNSKKKILWGGMTLCFKLINKYIKFYTYKILK